MIDLFDVTKVYAGGGGVDVVALDSVSMSVPAGSIHGIVGQSGAGKSTLVRCLTGLERPTSGTIRVDGQDISALSGRALRDARRRIGMVFQKPNLMDQRTAASNVAYPLVLAGQKNKVAARVEELLEVVGLADRAASYPSQLSGGQQQRVGIARAMATNPPVLLCDEPTSALDSTSTAQVVALLRELRDKWGVTIVIVTHQMGVVRDICDSATLLRGGKVVQSGSLQHVFRQVDSQLAAELVPRPNIDGVELAEGQVLLEASFTSSPGVPTGAAVLGLVAAAGADVAAGRFESMGAAQVGRLALAVAGASERKICEQLRDAGVAVRRWNR